MFESRGVDIEWVELLFILVEEVGVIEGDAEGVHSVVVEELCVCIGEEVCKELDVRLGVGGKKVHVVWRCTDSKNMSYFS